MIELNMIFPECSLREGHSHIPQAHFDRLNIELRSWQCPIPTSDMANASATMVHHGVVRTTSGDSN